MANEEEKLKATDIYKKLPYHEAKKPELLEEKGEVEMVIEKPSPGTIYGQPAPTKMVTTPLHKKGKMVIDYAAQLTQEGKDAILASDANDNFKNAIAKTKVNK